MGSKLFCLKADVPPSELTENCVLNFATQVLKHKLVDQFALAVMIL